MAFCVMPFSHLNVKHEGKVSACWRYPDAIGDYRHETLEGIWNGESLRALRRSLLNDERPVGCRSCWDMEDSGIESTRQKCARQFPHVDEADVRAITTADGEVPLSALSSLELRFDNTCNLMCRHCSPDYSSVWEAAVRKDDTLREIMIGNHTYRKEDRHVKATAELIDEAIELAPRLRTIFISGGEPLYHPEHYRFLDAIKAHAPDIALEYNSNLTTLALKDRNVLDIWPLFKSVTLRISLDADPIVYPYVRSRGDLLAVERNIASLRSLTNLRMSATCTVSMLNITRLPEIARYFESLDLQFHASLVQYPRALNVKLLPRTMKKQIMERWDAFMDAFECAPKRKLHIQRFGVVIMNYMNSDDWSAHLSEFVSYTRALDRHHRTDLLEFYPEFREIFQNM